MGNRMGYRILNFLLQYNTHVLIVILLVAKFFWDHKYHTDIFFRHTEIYEFLEFVTYAVITVLFIFNVLCVKYKATTNRKFIVDRLRYGCSYHYLINYFKDSDMHSMDIRNLPIKHWTESNGIILGKVTNKLVELPPSAGKNIAMFGIPKSGKTVTLISTCMQYSGSILAIDIKGDIYNATHKKRQIKVFSPSEPEASMLYNPLYGISQKDSEEQKRMLIDMATILLPMKNLSSDGQYFVKGARSFFVGISLHLLNEIPLIDLPTIIMHVLNNSAIDFVKKIKAGNCRAAQEFTNSFYGENPKNVSGCYAALCDALRPYNTESLKKLMTGFNFNDEKYITPELLETGCDIYLKIKQSELEFYAPLLALITHQFMDAFKNRQEGAEHPILLVLDEFPQLGKLEGISTALATLRSKNVTALLAMQSIAQLDKWYGEAGRKEIIDCCSTLLFFRIQDTNTRKWASDFIGTRKSLKTANNRISKQLNTTQANHSEVRETIFQPEDFGDFGKDKVLISDNGKYVLADIVKYYEDM